ncbi:TetR/AcrR family transcriptional regulator [Ramlibacter sp. PS4R-6]|uniref:TetR/AcrR family transcriptional regulator n=1 Tax=Ramlibacter sp. PS4R-6 TaxID=3133438 RepID=UPI0030A0C5DB
MAEMPVANREHRTRVLEGMAHAVSRKGYADTTIADIVGEASVSRRTFYEHFDSKAECLIALYEAASHNSLKVLRDAIDPAHGWQTQVDSALRAYLGCMASNPVLVRTLFIEILHLGAEGLASRRRVNQELADFIVKTVGSKAITPKMAMAIVGGINELVLEYIEQDKVDRLGELVEPSSRLVHAVTGQ